MGDRTAMLLVADGRVLMVHQRYRDATMWVLPGGSPRAGEPPHQTAMREVREETGYDTLAGDVVVDIPRAGASGRYRLVRGRIVGGRARLGPDIDREGRAETLGLGWLRCDEPTDVPEREPIAQLLPEPPDDVGRLPHGYRNHTRVLPGHVVEKRYRLGHETQHLTTETRMLRQAAGRLPVPAVLGVDRSHNVMWMQQLDGVNGQRLLERNPDMVLAECGRLRRGLNEVLPDVCHGDFGPHNLLFDPGAGQVVGLLDWENAHPGPPEADVAWAEFVVRMHHSDLVPRLPALFAGFGATPSWATRHRHMMDWVRTRLEEARTARIETAVSSWADKLRTVCDWTE